jgi:hypothetical protein
MSHVLLTSCLAPCMLNLLTSQSVGPGMLKAVLTPDQFERWEALLLQRTLDQVGGVRAGGRVLSMGGKEDLIGPHQQTTKCKGEMSTIGMTPCAACPSLPPSLLVPLHADE